MWKAGRLCVRPIMRTGMWSEDVLFKIGNRLALPMVKSGFDLIFQHRPAPMVFDGFADVEKGFVN